LRSIPQIRTPRRDADKRAVYHFYTVSCELRDELQKHLIERGVDAKVHYPIPMHLQPAAAAFGHKPGDFPVTEARATRALSLPVHEFITREQQDFVVETIGMFYAGHHD